MADKLITPEFRGSFVALVKPVNVKGESDPEKARYQVTIVLPKKDKWWKQVAAEITKAAEGKFNGSVPAKLKRPVKDGDESGYPEFEGCYTLQASSTQKPDVVNKDMTPIDPFKAHEILYSGAWYRVSIRAYAWEHKTGGKGVSFSLDNVMKIRDDTPLSGKGTAAGDFAEFAEESDEGDADDLLG
jgi:hypothetical protein